MGWLCQANSLLLAYSLQPPLPPSPPDLNTGLQSSAPPLTSNTPLPTPPARTTPLNWSKPPSPQPAEPCIHPLLHYPFLLPSLTHILPCPLLTHPAIFNLPIARLYPPSTPTSLLPPPPPLLFPHHRAFPTTGRR